MEQYFVQIVVATIGFLFFIPTFLSLRPEDGRAAPAVLTSCLLGVVFFAWVGGVLWMLG